MCFSVQTEYRQLSTSAHCRLRSPFWKEYFISDSPSDETVTFSSVSVLRRVSANCGKKSATGPHGYAGSSGGSAFPMNETFFPICALVAKNAQLAMFCCSQTSTPSIIFWVKWLLYKYTYTVDLSGKLISSNAPTHSY